MKETRDTMLGRHDPASIERALNETSPPLPFPPASDRTAWEGVREAVGEEQFSELFIRAESDAQAEIPRLPATLYLEFSRPKAATTARCTTRTMWATLSYTPMRSP
jgi:hypothetical protein